MLGTALAVLLAPAALLVSAARAQQRADGQEVRELHVGPNADQPLSRRKPTRADLVKLLQLIESDLEELAGRSEKLRARLEAASAALKKARAEAPGARTELDRLSKAVSRLEAEQKELDARIGKKREQLKRGQEYLDALDRPAEGHVSVAGDLKGVKLSYPGGKPQKPRDLPAGAVIEVDPKYKAWDKVRLLFPDGTRIELAPGMRFELDPKEPLEHQIKRLLKIYDPNDFPSPPSVSTHA